MTLGHAALVQTSEEVSGKSCVLAVQISCQAQRFVDPEMQILWQTQPFVDLAALCEPCSADYSVAALSFVLSCAPLCAPAARSHLCSPDLQP